MGFLDFPRNVFNAAIDVPVHFVTHFTEYDALRAASYWRYNHHLGLLAVIFGAEV